MPLEETQMRTFFDFFFSFFFAAALSSCCGRSQERPLLHSSSHGDLHLAQTQR